MFAMSKLAKKLWRESPYLQRPEWPRSIEISGLNPVTAGASYRWEVQLWEYAKYITKLN